MHWLTGNSPVQLQLVNSSSTYSVKLHNFCISAQYVAWVVCACMHAWCDKKGLDIAIHPIPKCVICLEDLLQEIVAKKSKDPFGTIRVARKALSKLWHAGSHCTQCLCIHRELQRGVPPPYGEQFSKETLIKSASSKAFAATTEARIGKHTGVSG